MHFIDKWTKRDIYLITKMTFKKHILDLLLKVGLNESEAELYLAASKFPRLTLRDLREKTGYSTAQVYRAFERLKELGLITSSQDNWKKSIEAVSLRAVGDRLAGEQRRLRKAELELKKLDNIMSMTRGSAVEEPVEILTDQNKLIEKAYRILDRNWDHLLAYGAADRLIDVLGSKPEHDFINLRCRKGKTAQVIETEFGPFARELMKDNDRELRNTKVLLNPAMQDSMTYIYGDEMTVWHKDKRCGNRAVVIKDPTLIKMHENLFSTMWENAK